MLKEIFEQEEVIQKIIRARYDKKHMKLSFPEIEKIAEEAYSCQHITIIACGSSYHAGYVAMGYFEQIAGVDCRVEIASEYRYGPKHHLGKTIVIALSQSGETADTLAATEECKKIGQKIISLCNVEGSTLTRISDATLFLQAGPERAVASTKTLTAQLCLLYLLSVFLAWKKGKITISQLSTLCDDIEKMPSVAAHVLEGHRQIQDIAKKYALFHDFYFLGRGVLYPTALEAALKLKEIAYKNAVGYPAGEMKHGPIALLDNTVPTIVFCASTCLEEKIISNLRESKARGAPIIVFGWKELSSDFAPYSDDVFFTPISSDILAPIGLIIATQLFSYYMARELCLDIDRPRNLAKSVTVE